MLRTGCRFFVVVLFCLFGGTQFTIVCCEGVCDALSRCFNFTFLRFHVRRQQPLFPFFELRNRVVAFESFEDALRFHLSLKSFVLSDTSIDLSADFLEEFFFESLPLSDKYLENFFLPFKSLLGCRCFLVLRCFCCFSFICCRSFFCCCRAFAASCAFAVSDAAAGSPAAVCAFASFPMSFFFKLFVFCFVGGLRSVGGFVISSVCLASNALTMRILPRIVTLGVRCLYVTVLQKTASPTSSRCDVCVRTLREMNNTKKYAHTVSVSLRCGTTTMKKFKNGPRRPF